MKPTILIPSTVFLGDFDSDLVKMNKQKNKGGKKVNGIVQLLLIICSESFMCLQ